MTPFDRTLTNDRLAAAVTRLDPASRSLTLAEQHRAADLKARLTGSAADGNVLGRPTLPGPARRRSRARWVVLGAGVAAVSVGLLVAPLFGDEERRSAAWSATPVTLDNGTARDIGNDCLKAAEKAYERRKEVIVPGGMPLPPAGSFEPVQRRMMRLVVGESRGPYDVVVLGNESGFELECLRYAGDDEPIMSGGTYPLLAPPADSVSVTGSGQSQATLRDGRTVSESLSVATGRVGQDVAAVTLGTPAGDITATVENGWFSASWPGSDPADGNPFAPVTVILTLADGTKVGPTPFSDLPGRDVPRGAAS